MEETLVCITRWKSQSEKVTCCMIPTVWHSGRGKITEMIKRQVVARSVWRGKRWIVRAQRIFRAMKILHMILKWWNLSNPIECTILNVNPKVNYELWVSMVCQWRSIPGKNPTILVSDIDNEGRGVWLCEGGRDMGNLYTCLNVVNLKMF